MSLFCLLWTPLFYFFWRSIAPGNNTGSGGVWALLLGSVVALVQFLLGSFINAGGFGISRWAGICIDIVSLPAVLPLLVCALFSFLRIFSASADFVNFTLLWLIPGAAIRTINWSAQSDPSLLVLVPLLWTAIAVGIPFFINIIMDSFSYTAIPLVICIAALPFIAATAYWAFFSQKLVLGFLLSLAACIPMGVSVGISFFRSCGKN
jgi:hypothetical protein